MLALLPRLLPPSTNRITLLMALPRPSLNLINLSPRPILNQIRLMHLLRLKDTN